MQIETPAARIPPTASPMATPSPSRRVHWRTVLASQDWGGLIFNVIMVAAAAITAALLTTADRPFSLYDATISYQYNPDSSIPYWLVGVLPICMMLGTLAVLELGVAWRDGGSRTSAVAAALHWLLDFLFMGGLTTLLTDVYKQLVGRYRPDYLDRCGPAAPPAADGVAVAWGLPASSNPACLSDLDPSKLEDGHKSFPSGHASVSAAFGVYLAGYVIWAVFYRPGRCFAAERLEAGWRARLAGELAAGAAFLWAMFQLAWAWGVAVSRIIDNKHHPSDVVGGALLGATLGGAFLLRAVPRHTVVTEAPGAAAQQPLLDCGGDGAGAQGMAQA